MTVTAKKSPDRTTGQRRLFEEPYGKPETEQGADTAAADATRKKLADHLQLHFVEMTWEVNWFTRSKKIDQATLAGMLKESEASTDSVTASKTLFGSKHPLVKSANEAKRAFDSYLHSVSASAAAFAPVGVTEEEAREWLKKEAGVRYVEMARCDEVLEHASVLAGNLRAAAKALSEGLESVKEFDKGKLKKLFNDADYPKSVDIQVRGPFFKPIAMPVNFEELAPKAADWTKRHLLAKLSSSVDVTMGDILQSFMELAKSIANSLRNRIELKVPSSHEMAYLRDAEVLMVNTPKNDPDCPAGKLLVNVRYKPAGKPKSETKWLELTEDEYAELRPHETEGKRELYGSVFTNLRQQLTYVKTMSSMMGDDATPLVAIATKLEDAFANIGESDEDVCNELRKSAFARKQTAKLMNEVAETLATSMVAVKSKLGGRRRSIKVMKQDDES